MPYSAKIKEVIVKYIRATYPEDLPVRKQADALATMIYTRGLQSDVFSTVGDPLALYPPDPEKGEGDSRVRVGISTATLGSDLMKLVDPRISMMWVERGNPLTQNPETPAILKALRQLEYLVVVDQFMTDTAKEANLILPAKTLFEQTDLIGAYWHYSEWHSGQYSKGYAALSALGQVYSPNMDHAPVDGTGEYEPYYMLREMAEDAMAL